ncbi:MAG: hypothetical protein HYX93_05750 [Chloroflexi bacterium]|nr:hypothetical protein [Chloroflexota bacterium]
MKNGKGCPLRVRSENRAAIMGHYFFSGAQPYEFFQHVAQLVQKEQKEGVGEGGG